MYTDQQIKDSIFLPKTTFSMRANLKEKEPQILAFWKELSIYEAMATKNANGTPFVLHDGPPYANGSIHLGHALNKTLKDVASRFARMQGFFVPFTPGWDCHGLPIEWGVEKNLLKQKMKLNSIEFRQECRAYAQQWVEKQSADFQRLGVCADFQNPYTTMQPAAEARMVGIIHQLLLDGLLYRSTRPVYWSIAERTALAEAEVEYIDKVSHAVFLKYPLIRAPEPTHKPAFLAVWTTTPWTIPASQAVAFSPDITYIALDVGDSIIWCAQNLWPTLAQKMNIENAPVLASVQGSAWETATTKHPWHDQGYTHTLPLLPGKHVTDTQGTGFVHTAPAHGIDDFFLCKKHNIAIRHIINDKGAYLQDVPLVAEKHIFKDIEHIVELLQPSLLFHETITHSYPHSWRSKKPLVMRATPQWFISIDALRDKTIDALPAINWIPQQSHQRLFSMLSTRPDWCVSRQRVWGVPLALFVHKETQAPLMDHSALKKIENTIARFGSDVWFDENGPELLPEHLADEYEKVNDIVDVWFESGTSFSYVLQASGHYPADLLIEGSDQHRGWFQSSLLCSMYTTQKFCTKNILTHGFIVDQQGKKMSKSQGNTLNVAEIVEQYGADILRLAIMQSDYHNDIKVGHDILRAHSDTYRKIRNSLRFLLGNLHHHTTVFKGKLPLIERYMLHRIYCLHEKITENIEKFAFHEITKMIHEFCTHDLSAFYFDIRKDTLYCESASSLKRLSCLHVLQIIFKYLTHWLAPILPFTAEDAWQNFSSHKEKSIHLSNFPRPPQTWHDPSLAEQFKELLILRASVFKSIEQMREMSVVGSSLETCVEIFGTSSVSAEDLEDLLITSQVWVSANASPVSTSVIDTSFSFLIKKAPDKKCTRCWKQRPDIKDQLCQRCHHAMKEFTSAP